MSIELRGSQLNFIKMCLDQFFDESVNQYQRDVIAEIAEEIEEDLLNDIFNNGGVQKTNNFAPFCLPSDDEVMSYDLDGNVLSCFVHNCWYLRDQYGVLHGFHFTAKCGENDAYRNDPQATSLALLERLQLYAFWPGKDRTQRNYTVISLKKIHLSIRTLLSWFYKRGYFLRSSTDSAHQQELITAEEVRSELVRRTSEGSNLSRLDLFLVSVRNWMRFRVKIWCPEWFRPTFSFKDVIDKNLAKVIANYKAKTCHRWEAIDFDSLKPLFSTAKSYLELYAKDIFWLLDRVELSYKIFETGKSSNPRPYINSRGWSKDIFETVCERSYSINPQSGHPWFVPVISLRYKGKERHGNSCKVSINLTQITNQVRCLVGAAIFVLFSFTGMRHGEMKAMKTGALLIDGKELDESGDVFAQVDAGTTFDLIRTIYKFKPEGEQLITPIPKIAARAYAVLVKVYSYSRIPVNPETVGTSVRPISDFLFPAHGLKFWWQSSGSGCNSGSSQIRSLMVFLKWFCDAADVDYFFPHQCRKTLATLLINEDPECLEVIRWLLGHNSIMMTYEYIMSLPGIRDEVLQYLKETNIKNIAEFVGDTLSGCVAGAAGNRALDAVVENIESWKGQKLEHSIKVLMKSYDSANFALVRTPAAWCVRFPSRIPRTAPCLPPVIQEAIMNGEATEAVVPRFEHCIPWKCGDAGHSRGDLETAKNSYSYARKMVANSSGKACADYQIQADYWKDVAAQLEYGRQDVVGECLLSRWASNGN